MVMLVDSHCHLNMLNLKQYQNDLQFLLQAARDQHVERFLCIGVDFEHAQAVIDIAERFSFVFASVGVHPSEKMEEDFSRERLLELASHPKVIAIGETGLDYYYNQGDFTPMQDRFRAHIQVARELKKPLIIHSRNAREDTIRILQEENAQDIGGIMHCFTEDWAMAEQAIALNFHISISGIVTFKNAKNVQEVATKVPLDKLLIETDSPYLAPEPYRGKSNEPQFVRFVAQKIADLKQTTFENIAEQTTENFFRLFPTTR